MMKKCISCGALQEDTSKFCSNCGASNFTTDLTQAPVAERPTTAKKRSHAKWIPFLLGGIAGLIVALIVVTTILSDPVDKIMRKIRDDDFSSAVEVYQEHIIDDEENFQEAYDEVTAYVAELMAQFRDHTISYEDLTEKLTGIQQLGILGFEIDDAFAEAGHLNYFRQLFAEAEKEFENGNYRSAIELYEQVANSGMEHSEEAAQKHGDAVSRFRDDAIAEAQTYIDSGEYGMAMSVLLDALDVLPNDPALVSAQQDCMDAEYDATIQKLTDEARLYVANMDFVAALDFLDSCIENYPDELRLQEERSACLTAYETYVIEESLKLAHAGEYQHALSLAEAGLGRFDSLKVTELGMIYKSHIPVILGEMEIFQNKTNGGSWASKTNETNTYLVDNYGNTYANSLSVGCGSLTYLVNFKYQEFHGTVAFPKGLESDGYRSSATLEIYGDGEVIAEFVDIDSAYRPTSFSLDISSYEKISLKWTCDGANIWYDWGEFATIFDGTLVPVPMELPAEI